MKTTWGPLIGRLILFTLVSAKLGFNLTVFESVIAGWSIAMISNEKGEHKK